MLLSIIFLIIPTLVFSEEECPEERRSVDKSWEAKLREDLFCNYTMYSKYIKKSISSQSSINVKTRMLLKYYSFDKQEEQLTVHSWFVLMWYDDSLTWNVSKYGDISEMVVGSYEIWTPTLSILNVYEINSFSDYFYTMCSVDNTGLVMCVPQLTHTAACSTKLSYWPYDTQSCKVTFGSTSDSEDNVNFTFLEPAINTNGAEDGPGWSLADVKSNRLTYTSRNSSKSVMEFVFTLDRQSSGPAAVTIAPTIVVSFLTIMALLQDVNEDSRVVMISVSLSIHYMFINLLSWNIPKHSAYTPVVLLFVKDSIILTLLVVVMTLFVKWLRNRTLPAPLWIVSVTGFVSRSPRFMVLNSWLTEPDVCDDEDGRTINYWIQFSNIFNTISSLVVILVYLVLACFFIPH